MAEKKVRRIRAVRNSSIKDRLAFKSSPQESGCILWMGRLTPKGYGTTSWRGKAFRVHRLAWLDAKGPIPDGLEVCHTCDVRHCINPDHLFLGTHDENMADMVKKGRGRSRRGSAHGNSVLTEDQVMAIRLDTRPTRATARAFGVSPTTVGSIRRRETWGHL